MATVIFNPGPAPYVRPGGGVVGVGEHQQIDKPDAGDKAAAADGRIVLQDDDTASKGRGAAAKES